MKKLLYTTTAFVLCGGIVQANAACIATPSCYDMGYSSTSSCEGGLKCPFDNYWNCDLANKINEVTTQITELEKQLIEEYSGKKIEVNGEQGKIKLLPDGKNYGFFKTRVRKYYTPFNFKSIKYLKLVK